MDDGEGGEAVEAPEEEMEAAEELEVSGTNFNVMNVLSSIRVAYEQAESEAYRGYRTFWRMVGGSSEEEGDEEKNSKGSKDKQKWADGSSASSSSSQNSSRTSSRRNSVFSGSSSSSPHRKLLSGPALRDTPAADGGGGGKGRIFGSAGPKKHPNPIKRGKGKGTKGAHANGITPADPFQMNGSRQPLDKKAFSRNLKKLKDLENSLKTMEQNVLR